MFSRRLLCCLVLFLCWVCLPAACGSAFCSGEEPVFQEEPLPDRRLLLLVVDRLGYPEFSNAAGPVLASLTERGAVALMNVRSGRSGSESGYLSLGTGARAVSGSEGNRAYQRGEPAEGVEAELLFQRYNGYLPGGEVFFLLPALLQEKNEALNYPVQVGLLGRSMAEHGLTVAVLGNADTGVPGRGAVLMGMDDRGEVPRGRVGEDILLSDPRFPFGKRSDIPVLAEEANRFLEEGSALVIVDFGDLYRLDESWLELAPRQRRMLLKETMARLDLLLGRLVSLLEKGDALMLVVPSPPQKINGGTEQLVPFLLVAEPEGPAGLAGSPTTRRPGLVANTDLVHLIFAFFDLEPAAPSFGAAMTVTSREQSLSFLDTFFSRTASVYRQRPVLLKGYVLLIIAALLASLAGLALKQPFTLKLSAALELLMLVPLVLLLLPAWHGFPPEQPVHTALLVAGGVLLGAAVLYPLKKNGIYLYWSIFGLGTAFLILLDTLAGALWQKYSFLGYDPIGGSRYYGIGNEYMGVLIGATILGTVALVALFHGKKGADAPFRSPGMVALLMAVALFYMAVIFTLASPRMGANLGGTLSAAVAFGISQAGLVKLVFPPRYRLSWKRVYALSISTFSLLALVLLWALNIRGPQVNPSHVGRFGEMLQHRGLEVFWETAYRKLAMNWRLVKYSIWSRVLVTFLGLQSLLFFYPLGLLKSLKQEQPPLLLVVSAALAGSITALLANDSGVVAAATILLFGVPPVLMAMIRQSLEAPGIN